MEIFSLDILRNSELSTQIDEHQMEIFPFETVEPHQETQIPEKHNYVISTKYMSRQDIVDGWIWGWLLTNFHNYGWTQIFQKFSYKHLNINSIDFYTDFFENCVLKNKFFSNLYEKQKKDLEDFFWNTDKQNTNVYLNDYVIMWARQKMWHKNRKQTQLAINNWAKNYFKNKISSALLDDLILLSNNFPVNKDIKENTQITLNWNLGDFCNLSTVSLIEKKETYEFSNVMDWKNSNEFFDKLNYKHRYGFSRRLLRNISIN